MYDSKINNAFNVSIEIMKKHSKSFYQGFKMLPEKKFLAVSSLYAFFRTADDLVDDSTSKNKDSHIKELDKLKEDVLAINNNETINNSYSWWPAFEKSIKEYNIPSLGFIMQMEGQKSDLDFQDMLTLDDLIDYSRNVAGSVGRIMLPILCSDEENRNDENLLVACENLGIAMQITNILRDVGEDLRLRNRIYLPKLLLNEHNLTKTKIKKFIDGNINNNDFESFITLWEKLAKLSEEYYDSFYKYLPKLDRDSVLPVYASSLIYRSIMDEVRENNYNCLTTKQFVSTGKKLSLMNKAKNSLEDIYKYNV